jgi:hypothetical protein
MVGNWILIVKIVRGWAARVCGMSNLNGRAMAVIMGVPLGGKVDL